MSKGTTKSLSDKEDSDDSDSSIESISSCSSWKIQPPKVEKCNTSPSTPKIIEFPDSSSEFSDGTYEANVLNYLSRISIQETGEKSFSKAKKEIDYASSSSWESDSSLEPSFQYRRRTLAKRKIWKTLEMSMEEDNKLRQTKRLKKKRKPPLREPSPEKIPNEVYAEAGQRRNLILQQIQTAHLSKIHQNSGQISVGNNSNSDIKTTVSDNLDFETPVELNHGKIPLGKNSNLDLESTLSGNLELGAPVKLSHGQISLGKNSNLDLKTTVSDSLDLETPVNNHGQISVGKSLNLDLKTTVSDSLDLGTSVELNHGQISLGNHSNSDLKTTASDNFNRETPVNNGNNSIPDLKSTFNDNFNLKTPVNNGQNSIPDLKTKFGDHLNLEIEWFCEICSTNCETKSLLSSHMVNKHEGLVNFLCQNCAQPFCDATVYNTHYQKVHSDNTTLVACYLCKVTEFPSFESLLEHLKTAHVTLDLYQVRCETCKGVFLSDEVFKKHKQKMSKNSRNAKKCQQNLITCFVDKVKVKVESCMKSSGDIDEETFMNVEDLVGNEVRKMLMNSEDKLKNVKTSNNVFDRDENSNNKVEKAFANSEDKLKNDRTVVKTSNNVSNRGGNSSKKVGKTLMNSEDKLKNDRIVVKTSNNVSNRGENCNKKIEKTFLNSDDDDYNDVKTFDNFEDSEETSSSKIPRSFENIEEQVVNMSYKVEQNFTNVEEEVENFGNSDGNTFLNVEKEEDNICKVEETLINVENKVERFFENVEDNMEDSSRYIKDLSNSGENTTFYVKNEGKNNEIKVEKLFKNILKCEYCDSVFNRNKYLRHHLAVHHRLLDVYKCYICKKLFPAKYRLAEHFKIVHSGTTYTCELCGKIYQSRFTLISHLKKHTGDFDLFTCVDCKQDFKRKQLIIDHVSNINRKCLWCDEILNCRSRLLEHIEKKHRVHGRLECIDCRRDVRSLTNFWNHLIVYHPEQCRLVNKNCVICENCRQLCSSRHHLKKHQRKKCVFLEKNVCKFCNIRFGTNYLNSVHLRKVLRCAMCGERFECLTLLKEHVYYGHRGELEGVKTVIRRGGGKEIPPKLRKSEGSCWGRVGSQEKQLERSLEGYENERETLGMERLNGKNRGKQLMGCERLIGKCGKSEINREDRVSCEIFVENCDEDCRDLSDCENSMEDCQKSVNDCQKSMKDSQRNDEKLLESGGFTKNCVRSADRVEDYGKSLENCQTPDKNEEKLLEPRILRRVSPSLRRYRRNLVNTDFNTVKNKVKNGIRKNVQHLKVTNYCVGNSNDTVSKLPLQNSKMFKNLNGTTSYSTNSTSENLKTTGCNTLNNEKLLNCDENSNEKSLKNEEKVLISGSSPKTFKESSRISTNDDEVSYESHNNRSIRDSCSLISNNYTKDFNSEDSRTELNPSIGSRNVSDLSISSKLYRYQCYDCYDSYFKNLRDLECHRRLAHDSSDDNFIDPMTCEHCGKQFFRRIILEGHFRKSHCKICEKEFSCWSLLAIHCNTQHKIGDWKCDKCNKQFRTYLTLLKHNCLGVVAKKPVRKRKLEVENDKLVKHSKYKRIRVLEDENFESSCNKRLVENDEHVENEKHVENDELVKNGELVNNDKLVKHPKYKRIRVLEDGNCDFYNKILTTSSKISLKNTSTFKIVLKSPKKVSPSKFRGEQRKSPRKGVENSPAKKSDLVKVSRKTIPEKTGNKSLKLVREHGDLTKSCNLTKENDSEFSGRYCESSSDDSDTSSGGIDLKSAGKNCENSPMKIRFNGCKVLRSVRRNYVSPNIIRNGELESRSKKSNSSPNKNIIDKGNLKFVNKLDELPSKKNILETESRSKKSNSPPKKDIIEERKLEFVSKLNELPPKINILKADANFEQVRKPSYLSPKKKVVENFGTEPLDSSLETTKELIIDTSVSYCQSDNNDSILKNDEGKSLSHVFPVVPNTDKNPAELTRTDFFLNLDLVSSTPIMGCRKFNGDITSKLEGFDGENVLKTTKKICRQLNMCEDVNCDVSKIANFEDPPQRMPISILKSVTSVKSKTKRIVHFEDDVDKNLSWRSDLDTSRPINNFSRNKIVDKNPRFSTFSPDLGTSRLVDESSVDKNESCSSSSSKCQNLQQTSVRSQIYRCSLCKKRFSKDLLQAHISSNNCMVRVSNLT